MVMCLHTWRSPRHVDLGWALWVGYLIKLLYFRNHLKSATMKIYSHKEKSAKNTRGFFRFFYMTVCLHVLTQQLLILRFGLGFYNVSIIGGFATIFGCKCHATKKNLFNPICKMWRKIYFAKICCSLCKCVAIIWCILKCFTGSPKSRFFVFSFSSFFNQITLVLYRKSVLCPIL